MYIIKSNIDLDFLSEKLTKCWLVDVCHLWSRISPIVAGISEIWFPKLYCDGKSHHMYKRSSQYTEDVICIQKAKF
jgi:hypothetical protein